MEVPFVTAENIEKAYNNATEARINLTTYKHSKVRNGKHVMKVCAICDRFIGPECERFICIADFETKFKSWFHKGTVDDVYNIGSDLMDTLSTYYTQKHFTGNQYNWLNEMILSPRSYGSDPVKTMGKEKLGCCMQCKSALKNMKSRTNQNCHPCKYAIANGLMIGSAPQCMEMLNDVELALLSKARCEKHIFSYTAGAHSQIKGFHTIYRNDVQHSNAILNYMAQTSIIAEGSEVEEADEEIEVEEADEEIEVEDADEEIEVEDVDLENIDEDEVTDEETEGMVDHNCSNFHHNETKNDIVVIMAGPFTERQRVLTKQRTKINHQAMKEAMRWLCRNNLNYMNEDFDERIVEPHYVCCHRVVESSQSNIEVIFDITAVFPDASAVTRNNGGFQTVEDFKKHILGTMVSPSAKTSETLTCRASTDRLRDHEGNNLMQAFIKQFPYGTGYLDGQGNQRGGTSYLQYLMSLSNPNMHTPEFVLVVHNMFERNRLVMNSCMRVSDFEKELIGQLDNETMAMAIKQDITNVPKDSPAAMFLRKLRAVTGSVATSVQASKVARQRMFSMMARYGSPAIFFTISPDDLFNFRVLTMASKDNQLKDPPSNRASTQTIKDFATYCAKTRTAHPGLCALDFEHVMKITIN